MKKSWLPEDVPEELQFVETHCHLDGRHYTDDQQSVIEEAARYRVNYLIQQSCDEESLIKSRQLAEQYPQIYFTAGIHPHDAASFTDGVPALIKKSLSHEKCVAVGEIGLDYHYDFSPRDRQRSAFLSQLEMAEQSGMPVVLHVREAWDDFFAAMAPFDDKIKFRLAHCFTSHSEHLDELLKRGYYVAFGGAVTFKKMEELRQAALNCPLDRMLIETDAPYMTPAPFRGRRNEPKYVPLISRFLAGVKDVEWKDFAKTTYENSIRFFGL